MQSIVRFYDIKLITCLFITGLLACNDGYAQPFGIKGTVRTSTDNRSISGANVRVAGTALSHATDTNGTFMLDSLPAGTHTLIFSAPGYTPDQRTVTVPADGNDRLSVALAPAPGPIHQLRVYAMNPRNRDAFDARFRDHAVRIMRRHGFRIVSSWYTDDGTQFVYLLQWPDQESMRRGWEAFMADEEWARIKRESVRPLAGPIMTEILEDKVLLPAAWSPNRVLPATDAR